LNTAVDPNRYKVVILKKNVKGRIKAKFIEKVLVYRHAAINDGEKPPGNYRP